MARLEGIFASLLTNMVVNAQFKGIIAFYLAHSATVAYFKGIIASLLTNMVVIAQFKGIFAFLLAPSTTIAHLEGIVTVHSAIQAT
ncbi:hypothetical protein MKY14_15375 [Paenibacillus sp. FSL R5-0887]|uniref:hypothetical protein n=1 Tax=Paenibacillus sp. FSL R5-0887 TaxID=2921662 RepID=UPI0030F5B163